MRKGVPFALGTAAATAMLGFVVLFGLDVRDPDRTVFSGWQVSVTEWGLLGLAVLVGLGAVAWSIRRLRGLQGEGLVLGLPAVLAGLLLSGGPVWGAEHAQSWAEEQTADYHQLESRLQLEVLELRKHPPVMRSSLPAATPALAALVPGVTELGPGWYRIQQPAVTRSRGGGSADGARSFLQRATRTADSWDSQRFLVVSVDRYATPSAAATAVAARLEGRDGPLRRQLVAGRVIDTYRYHDASTDRLSAVLRQGALVWNLRLSDETRGERLPDAEVNMLLALVAAKAATAQ